MSDVNTEIDSDINTEEDGEVDTGDGDNNKNHTFAEVKDFYNLWRAPEIPEEARRIRQLIPVVSDALRQEAMNVGKDLDKMIKTGEVLPNVVKAVVIDIITRMIMSQTDGPPMTQVSQSALGYTVSGTYLVPGGGLFIKKSELARLGLRRQKVGVIDLYAPGDNDSAAQQDTDG